MLIRFLHKNGKKTLEFLTEADVRNFLAVSHKTTKKLEKIAPEFHQNWKEINSVLTEFSISKKTLNRYSLVPFFSYTTKPT